MRVDSAGYRYRPAAAAPRANEEEACTAETQQQPQPEQAQDTEATAKQQDVISMMCDALKKDEDCWWLGSAGTTKRPAQYARPKDNSSQLTRRLVAASGQFEVRSVISEANSNLISLRIAAALCKGKDAESAKAAVRRLERLIARASRKIKDLDNEDLTRARKSKAEKQKQQKRAEEIKQELRKKQQKRMAREHSYLSQNTKTGFAARSPHPLVQMDAATEAQIARLAEAMAAAESGAEAAGDSGIAAEGAGAGEAGPQAGAEAQGAAPAEAGVDITA